MDVSKGIKKKAVKSVIYSVPGAGKSTLASTIPGSYFLDIEGSTSRLDVSRNNSKITSWQMFTQLVNEFRQGRKEHGFTNLIVDTIDWLENLACEEVCSKNQWQSIEDLGYGKGWRPVHDMFGKFLNVMNDLIDDGCHVTLLSHASVQSFTPPESDGSYDRYKMKLQKTVSAYVNEWADMILFLNFKTHIIKDSKTKKQKGQGQRRCLYTEYNAAWDAKNRFNLPFEIDITNNPDGSESKNMQLIKEIYLKVNSDIKVSNSYNHVEPVERVEHVEPVVQIQKAEVSEDVKLLGETKRESFHAGLYDLMYHNEITDKEIRFAQSQGRGGAGYFPIETPIEMYPEDFVNGVLVAYFDQMFSIIKKAREEKPKEFWESFPEPNKNLFV